MDRVQTILRLGLKELASLVRDAALVGLILYAFTYAVYGPAKGAQMELKNASVAIIDEDRSALSARIAAAILPPFFLTPQYIDARDADAAMDASRYTFVIDIPPRFQADIEAHRAPTLQVNVDATAMSQAGRGSSYLQTIITQEIQSFTGETSTAPLPVALVTRAKFNPNLSDTWFLSVSQLISNITLLALILAGAAVVREREHGTLEHLLVMPIHASDIMLAKVWSNALAIVSVATLSLWGIVKGLLDVPIAGSVTLFVVGALVYLFSVTSLGILLAIVARSMPQFGLLAFLVYLVLHMLSGGITPLDAMPGWLQTAMQFSPTTHFVSFAMAILYRGADFHAVATEFAVVVALGAAFFALALLAFRRTVATSMGA